MPRRCASRRRVALVDDRLSLEVVGLRKGDGFVRRGPRQVSLQPRDAIPGGLAHGLALMPVGLGQRLMPALGLLVRDVLFAGACAMRRDLSRPRASLTGALQVGLDLLAARARGLEILGRVAADLGLVAGAALDLVAQGGQACGELGAVHGRGVGLRLEELARLQRAGAPVGSFGQIERHDVRVQLGRGVAVDGARAVVFVRGGDPLARRLGGMITPQARLDVRFHRVERHAHTGLMGGAHACIPLADQGGDGHALRRRERPVPRGAVRHRRHGLAVRVDVGPGCLVLDELFPGDRVTAVGEPCHVVFGHVTREAPPRRELPVPLARGSCPPGCSSSRGRC